MAATLGWKQTVCNVLFVWIRIHGWEIHVAIVKMLWDAESMLS